MFKFDPQRTTSVEEEARVPIILQINIARRRCQIKTVKKSIHALIPYYDSQNVESQCVFIYSLIN